MDDRGRLTLPAEVREALHWEPGDIVFVRREENGLHIVKGINPFDALAVQALKEYEAGETVTLEEFAKREGISMDDLHGTSDETSR
ncbi:MAG: AbrB/MazE/SpoVT family DNA-binding domain-containing protein [Bacilli bacterium]